MRRTSMTIQIFVNVDYQLSQEMHRKRTFRLRSLRLKIGDIRSRIISIFLTPKPKMFQLRTELSKNRVMRLSANESSISNASNTATPVNPYLFIIGPLPTLVPKGFLVVQIVLWYLDSGCSRHMTGDRARLINFVEKFIGTVRFGNDEYAAIVGYGDYKLGDTIISRVYYVEGLKHNLFSVGQFCDGGLEVAFRQHSCHIRNYDMVDLLKGSRTTNLYSISLNDMMSASPVCLLTKASSTKSWLWHRRLNHLNFGTLNELARKNLVRGLPMLKYDKDHLCPSCQLGKSKKASHPLKAENTNTEVLHTLHMDLCGPMRTESINGKKYVLVIVDDYTRFGWVRFLRSKDETPHAIEKFIVKTQRALNATVRFVRTDNGTEFVNKTLDGWFESVGISHETSVPRSPQQNGVVERRNRTLMEAARTMLIFAKAPLFLWAEAVATACYTLNRSLVHTLHGKTYYELLKGKKPNLQYFRVFGSLCYPTNDYDDVGKLKAKADIGIFVGYAPTKKAYRIYNKRTRKIQETIHVTFDELTEGLTSVQTSSGLAPQQMTSVSNSTELELTTLQSGRSHSELVKDPEPPSVPPTKKQVDDLFQWFDDDEVIPPPAVPIPPVNDHAAQAPENANGSPSTTVISEGAPAVTESLLPHQIPLPDTSDSDIETLFDHVDSNVFDTYAAPETDSTAFPSNTVNIDVTPNNQLPHVQKWTQAHSLENIIGDKDRPVFNLEQLETDAMWIYKRRGRSYTLHEKNRQTSSTDVDDGQNAFVLGLQVSSNPQRHFYQTNPNISEILKKFGFDSCTPIDTPMAERPNLDEDKGGKLIDPTLFRGMVGSLISKYIPPPKRANWVKPSPLPKKKQVTFQEPHRTSTRPTQKPPVQQNKKPNVSVNLSTRTKPATESRKPMPKSHTRNHRILPSKSVNARRAADHNRKLNVVDHNQFVIRSLKSVNTKTPQAKHSVNHTKKVWKATRNHNVNTTKTAWRPTRKVVGSVKPQWKPTGRYFALYDNCPLTRIMEPIVEPLELTPSVSSSSKVTMISRFTDCKLSDRKAGSKGLSGIFEC
ncbi:retrovirus-related pol polyprotein from transposon TNT 1-94 [Tanacetum coccineum]